MVNKKALATVLAFWSWKTQPFQLLINIFNAVASNETCDLQNNFVVFLGHIQVRMFEGAHMWILPSSMLRWGIFE